MRFFLSAYSTPKLCAESHFFYNCGIFCYNLQLGIDSFLFALFSSFRSSSFLRLLSAIELKVTFAAIILFIIICHQPFQSVFADYSGAKKVIFQQVFAIKCKNLLKIDIFCNYLHHYTFPGKTNSRFSFAVSTSFITVLISVGSLSVSLNDGKNLVMWSGIFLLH